jgi:thiamine-phosphate pyrophosphorylase
VTPPTIGDEVVAVTEQALAAGAPLVQVRTKDAPDRDRLAHVERVRRACATAGARCLVNDRVDLALAVSADGVHVGDEDLPVEVARRLLGGGAIVGATCRNPEAARRAVDAGASYLGVGPAFATTTKVGLPEPIGLSGVAAVASAVDVPVIAIAGVTVDRVRSLLDAGAWGVAVVGAVYAAADPRAAVAAFVDALGVDASPGRPR